MRRSSFVVIALIVFASACTSDPGVETTTTASAPVSTSEATTTLAPLPTLRTTTTVPSTTTTLPVTPPALETDGVIGVVGCSNTAAAVAGYSTLSSVDLLSQGGLSGGSLGLWGNPRSNRFSRYWDLYDRRRPTEGYAATWIQLCIRQEEHNGSFDSTQKAWMDTVVAEIHRRDEGIPVWISGVNTFEDGLVCETVGEAGPSIAAEAADWAAEAIVGIERGPDTGPMTQDHLIGDGTCHPNEKGRQFLGAPLVTFFDGTNWEANE